MKINPTSLSISQLFSTGNEQYVIPSYQRRYSWNDKQIWELINDIKLLEAADTHLLGTVVCLTGLFQPGLNRLEVVDGQQRLTSISILLHCLSEQMARLGGDDVAKGVRQLTTAQALGKPPERKVVLDSLDAAEYERLLTGQGVVSITNRSLENAFGLLRGWASGLDASAVETFLFRLLNQAVIIRLDVGDAKDAFKLFETINNRGLRLSSTDIIKNFLLGNAARLGSDSLVLARASWAKLIEHLEGTSFDAFFRHFLTAQYARRVTRAFVIDNFKRLFATVVAEAATLPGLYTVAGPSPADDGDEPGDPTDDGDDAGEVAEAMPAPAGAPRMSFAEFLQTVVRSADRYGKLVRCQTGNASVDRHLRNLNLIGATQAHGFLTHLMVNGCKGDNFVEVLRLTEAFLIRRHVCRLRANDNEQLFARLCGVNAADPMLAVRQQYRELSPADERFADDFATTSFTSGLIVRARYCLEKIEVQCHGGYGELLVAGAESVHVEHIIPQTIKTKNAKAEFGDWPTYLGADAEGQHKRNVARIGNLTLLAKPLNLTASNNPYERKTDSYRASGLSITQTLPATYPEFRFEQVEKRSRALAKLAVEIWPTP